MTDRHRHSQVCLVFQSSVRGLSLGSLNFRGKLFTMDPSLQPHFLHFCGCHSSALTPYATPSRAFPFSQTEPLCSLRQQLPSPNPTSAMPLSVSEVNVARGCVWCDRFIRVCSLKTNFSQFAYYPQGSAMCQMSLLPKTEWHSTVC